MVQFKICRYYKTRLMSCLGWMGKWSWCLKGLAGMDQLFLPIKTSEREKARKKRVKTHRLSTKKPLQQLWGLHKEIGTWVPAALEITDE